MPHVHAQTCSSAVSPTWLRFVGHKFWTEYISNRFSGLSLLCSCPRISRTSQFSHYIICFYFLSSVTVWQPIRVIKKPFIQFAAEILIFLARASFQIHRCGMSKTECGPDSISLRLFIWEKTWVVGVVMELSPNLLIRTSVTQANMYSAIVQLDFGSCCSLSTQWEHIH